MIYSLHIKKLNYDHYHRYYQQIFVDFTLASILTFTYVQSLAEKSV